MTKLAAHLGGHKGRTHTDPGLLEYFNLEKQCNSLLDVGCGPGGQVELAKSLGWQADGVDGDHTVKRSFSCQIVDFKYGMYVADKLYDLGWCVEFLEHVEEKYIPNYMPALSACNFVVVTHALPGEPGHHHVNCQEQDYWVEVFAKYNLIYDAELTQIVKQKSTMERDFIRRRGLAFINEH